ncbi:acetyl-CoA carboxylase biotin carboxyl carrier protein subunit [Variovorax sp. J2P1-31]|uniref:acetyl-CoA carboxylase biotin carboxyl carrier protein n=2 Tax=unclassified Variovorax TaxID=663243 RepID=UPI002576F849|nr:acetyl-CoA carboxylase biotin carboxyl carrier protein subunit [Variovorax sp. J2P1-31]MDM0089243.1 acetyl-CoA carboxylase biotin carboxyl carrier protein subunit [Variovorax sp. J22G40]MDM0147316.1 acetyl-CoA carboxylase biotin carboxyl carrier protein subunit [Variovorax sp. J2P1-31]
MSLPAMNTADIRRIAMHQRLRGVAVVEFAQGDSRLRLRMPQGAPALQVGEGAAAPEAVVAEAGLTTVVATALGLLRLAHPSRPAAALAVGDEVAEGDTMALLQVGQAFTEVLAPRAGRVEALLAHEGQCIDYGKPLFTLRCEAP